MVVIIYKLIGIDVVFFIDNEKIFVYVGVGMDYYILLKSLIIGLFKKVIKIG